MRFKVIILYYVIKLKILQFIFRADPYRIQRTRFSGFYKTLAKSPFYRSKIASDKIFTELPVIDKKIFMECFNEINTCGIKKEEAFDLALQAEKHRDFTATIKGITVGLSSGTSGNRGIFLASKRERAMWVANVLVRVLGLSLKKRKIAFFLRANSNLYASVHSRLLQFHFFDLFEPIVENLAKLETLQPTILVGQPSLLVEVAKAIRSGEISLQPQKVISVAEVLTPEDNQFLSLVFKQTIHQVYQCTEGLLAASCSKGVMHFNEDFIVVERKYIDDEKKRFHPIITDLLRRTQPVVRYELNDIIIEQKCSCGNKAMAIEQIVGRSDDILLFEGADNRVVKLFPDLFRTAILSASQTIEEYALVQKSTRLLELFIASHHDEDFDKAVIAIRSLLSRYSIENITIERIQTNSTERGYKLRRIKNEISKAC